MNAIHCRNSGFKVMAITALCCMLSAQASAENGERVVEESLVVKDPTVSNKDGWVLGLALEDYYMKSKLKIDSGDMPISMNMPGYSAWLAYGQFSLLGTYKHGKGDAAVHTALANVGTIFHDFTLSEYDINLRWVIKALSARHFSPYLLYGYSDRKMVDNSRASKTTYEVVATSTEKSNYFGGGAILPITDTFGLRADYRYIKKMKGEFEMTDPFGKEGDSYEKSYDVWTVSGYYNITKSVNVQAGVRRMSKFYWSGEAQNGYSLAIGYVFR